MLGNMVREAVSDPVETGLRVWAKFRERSEAAKPRCDYSVTANYEQRLHEVMHTAIDTTITETNAIWPLVLDDLRTAGAANPGPASYAGHNDGDPAFIRSLWCLMRSLKPSKVIETGVAHGVSSRFILEAMRRNGRGHLWSIDLPPPTIPEVHNRIGAAVDEQSARSWTYLKGSSRRRLPQVLKTTRSIDLFVHDSLHTEYNMLFEMRAVWPKLRIGGAMVIDDIDLNWAFADFTRAYRNADVMVCEHQPFHTDPLRQSRDLKGLFGIIIKTS